YDKHTSPSIYVRFPIEAGQPAVEAIFGKTPVALVIWTTTPWTLAANLAVVANPHLDYVGVPIERNGATEYWVIAKGRAEAFFAACGIAPPPESTWRPLTRAQLESLRGTGYRHPFVA